MTLMRKVVHAKLIAVKGGRPGAAAVAERIGSPAKLTDICLELMALDDYAMGVPSITTRDDYLPDRVVSQLDMAGVKYIRDIMLLADAEELRKDLRAFRLSESQVSQPGNRPLSLRKRARACPVL